MHDKLISIIIPCFNREKYISAAIESCLRQSYSNIEVIIVDDGSSDRSLDIAKKYTSADKRVKAFKIPHKGQCAARNIGLKTSNGEFVKFLDSDDLLLPYTIEYQAKSISFFQADMTIAGSLGFNDSEFPQVLEELPSHVEFLPEDGTKESIFSFIKRETASTGDILFSKNILKEIKGFDPALGATEEVNLWLRIAIAFPETSVAYHGTTKLLLKRLGHESLAAQKGNIKWVLQSLQGAAGLFLEKSPQNAELKKYIFNRLYTAMIYSWRSGFKPEAISALSVWKKANLKPPALEPWYHDTLHHIVGFTLAEQTLATIRRAKYAS